MKLLLICFSITILSVFSCQQSRQDRVSNEKNDSLSSKVTPVSKVDSGTILKSKLLCYFLNYKYKSEFLLKDSSLDKSLNHFRLIEHVIPYKGIDIEEKFILSFSNPATSQMINYSRMYLSSTYNLESVLFDQFEPPVKVYLNDITISDSEINSFIEFIQNDRYSDSWLFDNVEKIKLLQKEIKPAGK